MWHDARLAQARQCLTTLWWCGARRGGLRIATADRLVEMLLWPAMSYGSELAKIGSKASKEIETLQNDAGKQLLGTSPNTSNVMIRGELGWITLVARRHASQLRFFHRLQTMQNGRLARDVFCVRMESTIARQTELEWKQHTMGNRKARVAIYGFCKLVLTTLIRYGLQQYYSVNTKIRSKHQWSHKVRGAILEREIQQWNRVLDEGDEKSKRKLYRRIQPEWGRARYLDRPCSGVRQMKGRQLKTRMRCSTVPLQAILHMEKREKSPICKYCTLNEPEDQAHAMCICPAHDTARHQLFTVAEATWNRGRHYRQRWWRNEPIDWASMTAYDQMVWLLRYDGSAVCTAVNDFLVSLFEQRERLITEQ